MKTRLENPTACPFCGGTWILVGHKYSAICVDCGATGPDKGTEKQAGKGWNTRVETEKDAEITRLRTLLAMQDARLGFLVDKINYHEEMNGTVFARMNWFVGMLTEAPADVLEAIDQAVQNAKQKSVD